MTGMPVFVCVEASPTRLRGLDEGLSDAALQIEPVGYLGGFGTTLTIIDYEMVSRELAALGLETRILARAVKAAHGCQGALLAFAVEVKTWEEAAELPGFEPLGFWLNLYFVPPNNLHTITMLERDKFMGMRIKRCDVAAHYAAFEPPPYDENGVFVSPVIIPWQPGVVYFFVDDLPHFYLEFSDPGAAVLPTGERIAIVRQFMERCRNA